MPYYHTLGTIPRKRHIIFRKPDGGLYAELIRNRTFRDNPQNPVNWSAATYNGGAGTIALEKSPVPNTALTTALKLDKQADGTLAGDGVGMMVLKRLADAQRDKLELICRKLELLARIRYHSKGYIALLQRNEAYQALLESQKRLASEVKR